MLHRLLACLLVVFGLGFGSVYGEVVFDPDGSGPLSQYAVESFDFLPGNGLVQGALSSPGSVTQYYQARLGSVLDANGNVVDIPGLNHVGGFQITVIAGYTASGTWNQGVFSAGQSEGESFLMVFRNNSLTASDLAGAGFTDGTLIYSGTVESAASMFAVLPGSDHIDRFGTDNYPSQQTVVGGGYYSSFSFYSADGYVDAGYFPNGLASLALNSSAILPFRQINPSARFTGLDGSGNPTVTVTPALGAVNGSSGSDLQTQADGNMALVPEPGTVAVLVAGMIGVLLRRRRRR